MMIFHYASCLFLFIPMGIVIIVYLWSGTKRRSELLALGDWPLIGRLLSVVALKRRKAKDVLALVGLFFLIFASAGPQFGSKLKEVKHRGVDVFIALDTSRSMLAEDVPPSRMDHAKRSLSALIEKCQGNRVGIIAFAKRAIIQCPLTIDSDAARMFLNILDTNSVPEQGTSLGDAIRLALKSFPKDEKGGRALVLLTDGEDHHSDPIDAAQEAKKAGVVIFTIGIGTTKGDVIKNRDENGNVTEFLKHDGEMVMSRLDDALLSKIASITGGRYYRASSSDREIDEIADTLNGFDKNEFSSKIYDRLQERYQIFALIAFVLLLLEFFFGENPGAWTRLRQRLPFEKLFLIVFVTLACAAIPVRADVRDHVIKGNKLLKEGDIPAARAEFESARIDAPELPFLPYNIGTTYFLEQKFDDAKISYEQALSLAKDPDLKSKIQYNLGHVLFAQGQRDAAVEKFKESLKLNPNDLDAKYNIEYIKSGKTPKNPPQQNKKDQGGQGQKQKQDDEKNKDKDQKNEQDKQQNKQKEEEKKPGQLSKEDAERILQMMKDQESQKMKDAQALKQSQEKPKKKQDENSEDW